MDLLIEKYNYYPVSLGHNCFPRMYIEKIYRKSYPRLPFDYLGSTMWGINDLIRADFKDFASKDNLSICPVYHSNSTLHIVNLRYMIIFLHDHKHNGNNTIKSIKSEKYTEVEKDYSRRIQRWKDLLVSGSKLLFFRLARNEHDRIHQGKPEKEALQEFSEMMRELKIDFRILYFSYENPQGYDTESQIIYVNIPEKEKITDTLIQRLLSDLDVFRFVKNCI